MAARCRGFASSLHSYCSQLPRGPHVYFLSLGAGNSTRKSRNRVISRNFVDDDATRLLLSPDSPAPCGEKGSYAPTALRAIRLVGERPSSSGARRTRPPAALTISAPTISLSA